MSREARRALLVGSMGASPVAAARLMVPLLLLLLLLLLLSTDSMSLSCGFDPKFSCVLLLLLLTLLVVLLVLSLLKC